ncbi:MAG TPA: tetratricopeptide repeat protein [Bacteroidia bacterium]|nr:tetratricopeptide repeat protein [Bacteroidia bacterium]
MKKHVKHLLLVFLSCLFTTLSFAQTSTDEQLAFQYLQNKEFDKAVQYYEKFFNKKDGISYYGPYLLCLTKLGEYNKAEKMVKKVIKQYPQNLSYVINLGTLYKEQKEISKANDQYKKAIKQLQPNQQEIFALATEFIQLKEWDFAIETYRTGRKLLNGFYPFSGEIADVLSMKGDIEGMVIEYLSLLDLGDDQLQAVQNGLQPSFGEDKDEKKNEIIKTELLKKVQSNPEKTAYTELLIWFFIQEKNFSGAFLQSKALDKRLQENGERLMSLGDLCYSNTDFKTASKCFQYVIEKGKLNPYYIAAKTQLLDVQYKEITQGFSFTPTDLTDLENNFLSTINELGKNPNTVPLMKNLAHLQAFFIGKLKEAIQLLNEAIAIKGISQQLQAECKLVLGDILLMDNEIWDASLLYSQVELDFKHEPLGNEAKFRNAKLSYYNGEFKWAQAQLDVLKGSTEKLISNDAMELSLLISDNLHENPNDSLLLFMFSRADLLSFRNRNQEAFTTLDSIIKKSPTSSLADDILYKKYSINIKLKKFVEAAGNLQAILDNYSYDILGDDALFHLAKLNELYLNNTEKAKQLYEELLTKYPGSLYTVEARKRFRKLRGDSVN